MSHDSRAQQLETQITEFIQDGKAWRENESARIEGIQKQLNALDESRQRLDLRTGSGGESAGSAIMAEFQKNLAGFQSAGRCRFEIPVKSMLGKSYIVSTDLYAAQGASGISPTGQYRPRLRTLLPSRGVTTGAFLTLRQTGTSGGAAEQSPEGSTKSEVTFNFEAETQQIPTIASFVNVTEQALSDVQGMEEFLNATLIWLCERKIEERLIYGSGIGASMLGLATGAESFDTSILGTGSWDYATVLSAALTQIMVNGHNPTHLLLHPNDLHRLRTTRATDGQYVITVPTGPGGMAQVWGGSIVPTDLITEDEFLAFDISQVLLRERMAMVVEASREHSTNFTENKVTIRAEYRGQLQKFQETALVKGNLSTSPA